MAGFVGEMSSVDSTGFSCAFSHRPEDAFQSPSPSADVAVAQRVGLTRTSLDRLDSGLESYR